MVLGSVYLGAGHVAANAVNLVMQLVIARLLGPSAFGVYAFCFAINEFLNIVGAFSLNLALLQSRDDSQEQYDTALAICVGLGLLGLVLAAAVAPVLWQQRSPEAAWILMVMAVARVLRFAAQVPQARLERDLRYGAVSVVTVTVMVLPNAVAVGMAWLGWGAWSLGWRDLISAVMLLALTWVASGYRFRACVERQAWHTLMRFARPMFWSRTLEILMGRFDALAVGILLGNRATGLYHQARFVSEAGFVATKPVERLSFNLYARLQDDPRRLARAWELVNFFLLRAMLALSAVLLVFPEQTVRLLLGDEWLGLAPLMRWMALYAGLLPVFHNVKNLCYGLGQVARMVWVRAVYAALFVPGVALAGLAGSLEGMAAVLLLTTLIALALAWRQTLDLVTLPGVGPLARPLVVLAASSALLLWAQGAGVFAGLPWFVLPFLPPLVYTLAMLGLERGLLVRELRYLMDQVRQREQSA